MTNNLIRSTVGQAADGGTDVSPNDGSRDYGPFFSTDRWAIKTYPGDRLALVVAVQSDDETYGAVYVSSDGGDSWSAVVSPDTSDSWYRHVSFAGDSALSIYLWGDDGKIAFSADGGSSVDDRRGNIVTDFAGAGRFFGICGAG